MGLREELEKTGNWLFRKRSYLPLLLIGVALAGLKNTESLGLGHEWDAAWEVMCLLVSFLGLGIRVYTVGHMPGGTCGRSTRRPEAAVLNTTGIYSATRHPLYLGNSFIWLGISMFVRVWWVTLLFVVLSWWYYEKIMLAEEAFLREKFGEEFECWARRTPAFFPRLRNWKPADLPFSLRAALRRDYGALMAIIASFTFLEVAGEVFEEGKLDLDWPWAVLFSTGVIVYLTLRFLKRKSGVLSVGGR